MTDDTTSDFASDITRRLEAIMMILDEPHSLVSLAAAVGAPVPAVRQAIETLVADYDGLTGGPKRGFELREVGGGWRMYVREEFDDLVSDFVGTQAPSRLSPMSAYLTVRRCSHRDGGHGRGRHRDRC